MAQIEPLEGLERALTVFRALNQHSGVTISELSRIVGLPRAAVNRYVVTLIKLGYIFRAEPSHALRVSARSLELSRGARTDGWITTDALPEMTALCRDVGWPIGLETIVAARLTILANTDSISPFVSNPIDPQISFPLIGRASGHVLLAFSSPEVREDLLRCAALDDPTLYTRAGVTPKKVAQHLEEVSARGYDIQRVVKAGWIVIAVPVLNLNKARFSLSVRYRASALPLERAIARFIPKLTKVATLIAKRVSRLDQTLG
jgi:DNA-binding IclR family transcriptional regulator